MKLNRIALTVSLLAPLALVAPLQGIETVVDIPPDAEALRNVAGRLGQTTQQQQAEHFESKEIISSVLSYQTPPEVKHFPGDTKWSGQINDMIDALAKTDTPVRIEGEAGTGRVLA